MEANKKSVAILYGWAEGSAHGKYLKKALREEGFHVTRKPGKADVIIAHSGGALLLPKKISARMVLLVGVPYWPGRHPVRGLKEKLILELKEGRHFRYWLRKTLLNGIYSTKARHQYRIHRNFRKQRYPVGTKTCSYLAVRNQHDTFMHPVEIIKLADKKSWAILSFPGTHDDIWLQPDRYVAALKKHLADTEQSN